jgi:hypothetical protein
MAIGKWSVGGGAFSSWMSRGLAELGGDMRKVLAFGLGWNEFPVSIGFDASAVRLSPEETRLKCLTVDGELPKLRSTPKGCLGTLATRRAVGVAPEGIRMAVPVDDMDDMDDIRDDGRRRSGSGESVGLPNGAALRSMRCIVAAHAFTSPEGMRIGFRSLAVWGVALILMVFGCWTVKFQSSSSPLGERSTLKRQYGRPRPKRETHIVSS